MNSEPIYIMVVDQRALDARVAANVTEVMCQRHPIKEIYWIFSINDSNSYNAAYNFRLPKGCIVTLTNSFGLGVDKSYQSFFGKYASESKSLLLLPSAPPTLADEMIINKLPMTGVTIIEVGSRVLSRW